MIETTLENIPWVRSANLTGTITTAAGSTALTGAGTLFTTELAVGDIITLLDDAGTFRTYSISSITDNTNAVLVDNAESVASGVAYQKIDTTDQTVPFFKANNANLKSPVIVSRGDGNYRLSDTNSQSQISVNEGVLIKSVYVRFPYQYPMADTPFSINFIYLDNSDINQGVITNIGEDGSFLVPGENIEVPVNAYVPPLSSALTTGTWQIAAVIDNASTVINPADPNLYNLPSVSQVDAPDSFNGLYLPLFVGIRILHGLDLTT